MTGTFMRRGSPRSFDKCEMSMTEIQQVFPGRFAIGWQRPSRWRPPTCTWWPGYPPVLRVHGELRELDCPAVDGDAAAGLLVPLCPPHAMARFQAERNADFALELTLRGKPQRFRANYFMSGQQMGACFRLIPAAIPDFEWAGFPETLARQLTHFRNGLVLVCGVVGSGKTTSLAMLIHLLNQEGGYRIITVEEPVEYLFPKMSGSVVTQREVGPDVHTFADGLKYALRQDPDVILVGRFAIGRPRRWR